jgi:hypothetical protein
MAKRQGIALLQAKRDPIPLEQITLRDFFAAFACIGASSMAAPKEIATQSYAVADAMLDERTDVE